jgi:hypothetical protein
METVYTASPANEYMSLVLKEGRDWGDLVKKINRQSLASKWRPLAFRFASVGETDTLKPTICSVYLPGVLAFRSDLRDCLFPASCPELELLPIDVADEKWLLVNCLKSTGEYDRELSVLFRRENGEIFFISRVVVRDDSVRSCGLFTISDSNRGQLLFLSAVKERVTKCGAAGINFPPIGVLEQPRPSLPRL